MGTIRHHARIDRSPDEVWAVVADAAGLAAWMPGIDGCTMEGDVRTVATMGIEVQEQILVNDDALRRQQYSIVGGPMLPEHHLATIDVIPDGDGSLLIYSCDVRPDDLVPIFDGVYGPATQAFKAHLEG
jgi:hypothetical protein